MFSLPTGASTDSFGEAGGPVGGCGKGIVSEARMVGRRRGAPDGRNGYPNIYMGPETLLQLSCMDQKRSVVCVWTNTLSDFLMDTGK